VVHHVPLAGAVFVAEILLCSLAQVKPGLVMLLQ